MFTPDKNGKVIVERFSDAHEKLSALHDAACEMGGTPDQLQGLYDLLQGVEHDEDIAYEVAYSVMFSVADMRTEMEDHDFTAAEYLDFVSDRYYAI